MKHFEFLFVLLIFYTTSTIVNCYPYKNMPAIYDEAEYYHPNPPRLEDSVQNLLLLKRLYDQMKKSQNSWTDLKKTPYFSYSEDRYLNEEKLPANQVKKSFHPLMGKRDVHENSLNPHHIKKKYYRGRISASNY